MFLTGTLLTGIGIILITCFLYTILYFKYKYTYWSKRNVPFIPPTIPFGNKMQQILQQTSIGEQYAEHYNMFEKQGAKYGGLYMFSKPELMILDPDTIKLVLTKNFNSFPDRGLISDEKIDPLSTQLFAAKSAKWKFLRNKLSPTFTSGKMKMMFPTIIQCGSQLENAIEEPITNGKPLDIKDILGRFTTDVISSVAFGLDCNSLKNPDAEFRKYGKMVFERDFFDVTRRLLNAAMPKLFEFLKLKIRNPKIANFFINAIHETVEYREKNHVDRKDFMNLLIKLKNNENIDDDDKKRNGQHLKADDPPFTMEDVAAQAFVFFIAGFETSSSTMMFCLYELCLNPQMQEDVRREVKETLQKHNGQITYEAIMEMPYLDKVVKETLRKYPIVPFLIRRCAENFALPDSDLVIEKGVSVVIPVLSLHRNPKYYPDPLKFDPERFSEDEKAKRHSYTYLPFGEGPRHCIGNRFGLMQTKVGLTFLLKAFKFTLDEKMDRNFRWDPRLQILAVKGGMWLNATKIDL